MSAAKALPRLVSRAGCACLNARGTAKQEHASREAALEWILRTKKPGAYARIYKCPTADRWHVTTKPERA